jgi:hypothetical protein
MRKALPKAADVVARINFQDGRRLALPAKLRACE